MAEGWVVGQLSQQPGAQRGEEVAAAVQTVNDPGSSYYNPKARYTWLIVDLNRNTHFGVNRHTHTKKKKLFIYTETYQIICIHPENGMVVQTIKYSQNLPSYNCPGTTM